MSNDRPDGLTQAGEFEIEEATWQIRGGDAVDVIGIIDSIKLYEDIYSPFITGFITFRDTNDVLNAFGKCNGDYIRLRISTPGIKKKLSSIYTIYKISDRVKHKDREVGFTAHIASIEFDLDSQLQLSKSFKGSPSDIVRAICQNSLGTQKSLNISQAFNTTQWTSNFWSPSKNLTYACENAIGPNGDASFVFFENSDGFNFIPIRELILPNGKFHNAFNSSDFSIDIKAVDRNSPDSGTVSRDPLRDYAILQSMIVDTVNNPLDEITSGALNTELVTHDILTKKYDKRRYSHIDQHTPALNPNRLHDYESLPRRMVAYKSYEMYSGVADNGTNWRGLQARTSYLQLLKSSRIVIQVFGNTMITAGQVAKIDMSVDAPIGLDAKAQDIVNRRFSGRYLQTAVAHTFTRAAHFCTIELSKESTLQ